MENKTLRWHYTFLPTPVQTPQNPHPLNVVDMMAYHSYNCHITWKEILQMKIRSMIN